MSTEISTEMKEHGLRQFWGGDDRGGCVQITALSPLKVPDTSINWVQEEGYIKLTMEEAAELCNSLNVFITQEALRRQKLLKEQIARLHIQEKAVFHDTAELSEDLFELPRLTLKAISMFCPKV
jgi:hypothetical protein